jgi:hypothetical protein
VASTEQAVAKAKAYLESPVTFQEFLPANQCALAIALGNKTALHIAMLARVADAATQYLQAKNPEKLADWLSWLSENMGADSWDLTKLEAKSREFMPEAPPKPVLPYRTVEKCFDDFWTLVATINNPNTPEHQGCGGIAAFCEGLEPSQRKELANLVMTQYEALQDWVEILKELVA